jgi:Flp pilus assembly protein TadG
MIRLIAETIRRPLARFVGDGSGVSAVEFALISPLMIGLYLGGVEISQGIGVDRKVTLTAGAIANLSSQTATLSTTDMTNIMNAATAIMAPYSTTPLKITVSCLNIDANSAVKVKWSATQGGTARSAGSSVSIPSALVVANSQLLFSEVSYTYRPTIGYVITGTLNLSDTMYMSPRISAPIYGATACT